MKKLSLLLSALVVTVLMTVSCSTMSNVSGSQEVPFIIADHYFVRNDVQALPNGAITTAEEFHRTFGEATVMGGLPTAVNFKKQFVVAVSVPETNCGTAIYPVSLKRQDGKLAFTYHVEKGEPRSYTIQPVLLIVVDKKYQAPLSLKQE